MTDHLLSKRDAAVIFSAVLIGGGLVGGTIQDIWASLPKFFQLSLSGGFVLAAMVIVVIEMTE